MNWPYGRDLAFLSIRDLEQELGERISITTKKLLEQMVLEDNLPFLRGPADGATPFISHYLPYKMCGSFYILYSYTLHAYYLLRKSTPGWPIDLILDAARYATDSIYRKADKIGEFEEFALTLLYVIIVVTALLKLLKCDKTWALRIRTDATSVAKIGFTTGTEYRGKLWLERIT